MAGYVAMFVDEGGAGRRRRHLGVRSECDLFGGKFNPPITQICIPNPLNRLFGGVQCMQLIACSCTTSQATITVSIALWNNRNYIYAVVEEGRNYSPNLTDRGIVGIFQHQ